MGRPQHEYCEKKAAEIQALLTFGIPKERIANYVMLSPKTIDKHYAEIIASTVPNRHEAVEAGLFYNAVVKRNVVAQIFYLETQMADKYNRKRIEAARENPDDPKSDLLDEIVKHLPS